MTILSEPQISNKESCPYLKDQLYQQELFQAFNLSKEEYQQLIDRRFRRFGPFFFRPICSHCKKCIPIRIDVNCFKPSKGQRRVLKKNKTTCVEFRELYFSQSHYNLYKKHSLEQLHQDPSSYEDYCNSFLVPAVPSFLSEYYYDNKLVGLGYLDELPRGLSSVYFVFDPDYHFLSLGHFSIMKEIELCQKEGLDFYYTGYYIQECSKMNYKGKYTPYELLIDKEWIKPAEKSLK